MGKAKVKKPKPATAGERTVLRVTNSELQAKYSVKLKELRTSRVYAPARKTAAAIDRAIARAVRKERERCVWCAHNFGAMDGAISAMKEGRLHP